MNILLSFCDKITFLNERYNYSLSFFNTNNKMEKLFISNELLIGSGCNRDCYKHPTENKCIKILKSGAKPNILKRELKYMNSVRKRLKSKRNYYSDFIEKVPTNKGIGYVFDLVTDINNEISKTLADVYLDALLNNKIDLIAILDLELIKLKNNIINDRILTHDLHAGNVLVRMNKGNVGNLVIVDGIGRTNSIYLFDRFGFIGKRKPRKKFECNLMPIISGYKEAFAYLKNH